MRGGWQRKDEELVMRHKKYGHSSRGQALVEFALIVPIFVLVTVGIFDAGRAIFAFNAVSNATREALREAIVHQDDTAIDAEANAILGGLAADSTITHDKSDCTPVAGGCMYGIEISYAYQPATPIIGAIFHPSITASAQMPVETVNP